MSWLEHGPCILSEAFCNAPSACEGLLAQVETIETSRDQVENADAAAAFAAAAAAAAAPAAA